MSTKRYVEIDIAAGITMILVVFGHNFFPEAQVVKWYSTVRNFIYLFHMPLFMFLSGFIVFISYKPLNSISDYKKYILKKLKKFVPPYLILSFIYIFYDLYQNQGDIQKFLILLNHMVFSPIHGAATFLWYLYVLTIFYLITPFLIVQNNKTSIIILFFSLLLIYIPVTPWFSLEPASKFLFYFFAGGILAKNYKLFLPYVKKYGFWATMLFSLLFVLSITHSFEIPAFLVAATAIISILFISLSLYKMTLLSFIGNYTFYIYLFNSLVIGLIYLVFTHYRLFTRLPFGVFLVISITLGLSIPLLLSKFYKSLFSRKQNA